MRLARKSMRIHELIVVLVLWRRREQLAISHPLMWRLREAHSWLAAQCGACAHLMKVCIC